MTRAYSGVLGSIALCLVIVRGLAFGVLPNEILKQSLVVFFLFAAIGFCIGYLADKTICESVENRFRSEMASLQPAAAEQSSDASE